MMPFGSHSLLQDTEILSAVTSVRGSVDVLFVPSDQHQFKANSE